MKIGSTDLTNLRIGTTQVNEVRIGSDLVWSNISVLDYSPYNVWDSEHIDVSGTTTTLLDYNTIGTAYDMANPTASNQPTLTPLNIKFNSRPSIGFGGVSQYVENNVSGWRNGDSSGLTIHVVNVINNNAFNTIFSSSDLTSNNDFYLDAVFTKNITVNHLSSGSTKFLKGDTLMTGLSTYILAFASDGSNYKFHVNGVLQDLTPWAAQDDGTWLDAILNRGNIVIGARVSLAVQPSPLEWAFTGYFPYVDEATTLEIIEVLKLKYGIA